MDLEKALTAVASLVPAQFDDLRHSVDPAWVLQALEDTGTVSMRKRRLPAEQMVWLVIGMALILHYASQLWAQLEDDTVTVLDRGFCPPRCCLELVPRAK